MIDAGSPPDIIIDSTGSGVMSDVVKTMTWTLGLPTLSTSYGETDEIREWRDLSPQQQNYLIQIRPPGDVITGVIRELIERQNITNAAILYDDTFIMDYKYKNLLLNVPTRHIIHMVKNQPNELRQQLKDIAKVDLNNFFVLGSTDTISKVGQFPNASFTPPEFFILIPKKCVLSCLLRTNTLLAVRVKKLDFPRVF